MAKAQPKEAPKPSETNKGRRSFIGGVLGLAALSGAAMPLADSLLSRPPESLVPSSDDDEWYLIYDDAFMQERARGHKPYKIETIDLKVKKLDGWKVREEVVRIYVSLEHGTFSSICPHAGCVVEANYNAETYFCPCHKGHFNTDGSVKEGPSPRGLDRLETRYSDAGFEVRLQRFAANRAEKVAL